jgi:hypothetical protein
MPSGTPDAGQTDPYRAPIVAPITAGRRRQVKRQRWLRPWRSWLGSGGFADQTGVAGQREGGQAPDRGLHTPHRHGKPLTSSAVGVEVAACADSSRGQWQSAIQADSDKFHGGARGTDRTGEADACCRWSRARPTARVRRRYCGQDKTHLQHVFSAVALNLIRLNAWWNGHPLDRTRTSHLTRLELTLAA